MFRLCSLKCKNGSNRIGAGFFAVQSSTVAAKQTSIADDLPKIVIPKKVNRGPTDLLYTLSKTVGRDPTAAHFKYHDDPYLTPTTLYAREQYALSFESGKATAQWIRQQNQKYFNVSIKFKLQQILNNKFNDFSIAVN